MSDLSLSADIGDGSGGVQWDAWAAAIGGYALGSYIDRELNRPQMAYDQSQAYVLGNDGTLYRAGRPASNVGGAVGGGVNGTLLLVGIIVLVVLASKG